MSKRGPFPFVPNMEDCRKIVKTDGCTCYIMDTVCRHMTKESKAEVDRRIVQIALNAALSKLAENRSIDHTQHDNTGPA